LWAHSSKTGELHRFTVTIRVSRVRVGVTIRVSLVIGLGQNFPTCSEWNWMPGTQHVETETVNTVVIMQLVRFTEPMTKLGFQPSLKIGDNGVMT